MEIIRTVILLICIVVMFSSCEFFLTTPFPNNLTLFGDSVQVATPGSINDSRMFQVNNFIFLNIYCENQSIFYIFSPDLEILYSSGGTYIETFAMQELDGDYLVGNNVYYWDSVTFTNTGSSPFSNGYGGPSPPGGYGFSDGVYNYDVWWNDSLKSLEYTFQDSSWSYVSPYYYNVSLSGYEYLKDFYYDPVKMVVVMFFVMDNSQPYDMEIAEVPASEFAGGLINYITFPLYFYNYSARISDIRPEKCYYTGDGYVIEVENGNLRRYSSSGSLVKEIGFIEREQSEAYTYDGKYRYIFSRDYSRLIKTDVWW